MKKILFAWVVMFFIFACNQNASKTEEHEHTENVAASDSSLRLNNGAKWKSDSTTEQNVANLKSITDNFKLKSSPSVNDYHSLSNDIGNGFNQLVQQCKMTGPDHEQLHHWLEPLLEKNKELKSVSDDATAKKIFDSIDNRIAQYRNYFELK